MSPNRLLKRYSARPAYRSIRRFGPQLLGLFVALFILAGCGGGTLSDRMSGMPSVAAQMLARGYINKNLADYPLRPKVAGTPQRIAETYLLEYQPGPERAFSRAATSTIAMAACWRKYLTKDGACGFPWLRSPRLIHAMIATEDASFVRNDGVDTRRLLAAVAQNVRGEGMISGGSTITMQLARALVFPPEQRFARSLDRKINEALIAEELTRLYTKDEILEMYLNLAYFGHLAYGPEAAARTFFGKSARELSLAEASLLAGLPQQPANLDPFFYLEAAKQRQRTVLDSMVRRGYITQQEADLAHLEPLQFAPDPNLQPKLVPHFLQYLDEYLARAPDNLALARSGLVITTTLDLEMQNLAQQIVKEQVEALRGSYDLSNAALVALKVGTGEVLTMVGSKDYNDEKIGGKVNVALRPRQPGSSIKPVIYSTAIDSGIVSPATMLWDLRVDYPMNFDKTKKYTPRNYDEKLRGPVTVRMALANSLNIPTLKLFDGVDPDTFIATANELGITNINTETLNNYGLVTALGAAEVKLIDLATAYHAIANQGEFVEATPILSITDGAGNPIKLKAVRPAVQAISPEAAFIVTDIMSDNKARAPIFGENSRLHLSRPAAAKTGTTTNFRDNWTMGFTKYFLTGVWAGNNDGRPMQRADGITGAGPIWNRFMEAVIADPRLRSIVGAPEGEEGWAFDPPPGVVQVQGACPGGIYCREGGEYFTQAWLDEHETTGPYWGGFATGLFANVTVERASGEQINAGLCLLRPASSNDAEAATAFFMPMGNGRLALKHEVTTTVDAPNAGAITATTPTTPTAVAAAEIVTKTVYQLEDSFLADRVNEEQKEVGRWASQRGLPLVLGTCAEMEPLVRGIYGNNIRRVVVSDALPRTAIRSTSSYSGTLEADSTEEAPLADVSAGGNNGFTSPGPGATLNGAVAIQAVAATPNFWKWQLDLLVNGADASFIAIGEQPAPGPTNLVGFDTTRYPNGSHLLRLRVVRRDGNYDEYYMPITISNS
ncbi:MAG: transglycosylase domain-containing protein [Anaerolineales bacterium]|nr:transglycosylase domain-containing protein [Anaerolineales bacterium]